MIDVSYERCESVDDRSRSDADNLTAAFVGVNDEQIMSMS